MSSTIFKSYQKLQNFNKKIERKTRSSRCLLQMYQLLNFHDNDSEGKTWGSLHQSLAYGRLHSLTHIYAHLLIYQFMNTFIQWVKESLNLRVIWFLPWIPTVLIIPALFFLFFSFKAYGSSWPKWGMKHNGKSGELRVPVKLHFLPHSGRCFRIRVSIHVWFWNLQLQTWILIYIDFLIRV